MYDTGVASNRVRRAALNSSTLLLHLTGPESSLLNTTFQTSGNAITLVLVSDAEDEDIGFSLVLTAMSNQGNLEVRQDVHVYTKE